MFEIKDYYTNKKNEKINIRNINYPNPESTFLNFGKFINETTPEPNSFFLGSQTDSEGVYIFKSKYDETKALRIYKDWKDNIIPNPNCHNNDIKLITKLIDKQSNIKLTDLPTGIVTVKDIVIGQEIPLYENYCTLQEKIIKETNKKIFTKFYIDILNILKELTQYRIYYADIHTKNFMINEINNIIKIIDFDEFNISIDNDRLENKMINNLKSMLNKISEYKNIPIILKNEETLLDIEETIKTKLLK